jgi:hypothetical protein
MRKREKINRKIEMERRKLIVISEIQGFFRQNKKHFSESFLFGGAG